MFKALSKAVLGTVLLPVDLAADAVTAFGVSAGRAQSFTGERVGDIVDNLKAATRPERE